jgi:Uri superfamily endonuclease
MSVKSPFISKPDMDSSIINLPAEPGTYILFLSLQQVAKLHVGRLGTTEFASGKYAYLGSAGGPGGLRARLERHLTGTGTPRWHIDYLRAVAEVSGYAYITAAKLSGEGHTLPVECLWSQTLAVLPDAFVPLVGFGASDCDWGCPAHLVCLPPHLVLTELLRKMPLLRYNEGTMWIYESRPIRV